MHPSRDEIQSFIVGQLDAEAKGRVHDHIQECEFCQELLENLRVLEDALTEAEQMELPPEARQAADRLYVEALRGNTINLVSLEEHASASPLRMAADGTRDQQPSIQCLATMYSEHPEIVMRIMRNMDTLEDYLQLISDDPEVITNALVQVPERDLEYVADSRGRAVIDLTDIDLNAEAAWQIKMPDAVFSLQPLSYEPDRTEYSDEVVLTTKNRDRVRVTFEGKTQGKNISVEILELDGKDNFGPVTVVVSQDDVTSRDELGPHTKATFELPDTNAMIALRLYQR